jgi:hypothetical protein
VPSIGPAYDMINFGIKRVLGRGNWPRRKPGDVQSTGTLEPQGGTGTL